MKSKVVVVSLKDSLWRQKVISTQLDALGVEYEFFDAIDYRNADMTDLLAPDELKMFRKGVTSPLTSSVVGCFCSIRAAMQMVYDRGDDSVVLCEDDAFFSPVFSQVVEAIEQLDTKINLVSLGALWQFDEGFIDRYVPVASYGVEHTNLPHGRKVFPCITISMGCHGFFVRRNWMEQNLVDLGRVDMAIDWKLFGGNRTYAGWRALTPYWSLNLGGDIVYQGIGGDSNNELRSLSSRPAGPGKLPPWRTASFDRFLVGLKLKYLRLFR